MDRPQLHVRHCTHTSVFQGIKINADCPGFEIISQSSKELVIEDFTDMKEVNLDKVIMRLRSLVAQEFVELSDNAAATIGKMEGLVNRFYMLGIRYVNMTQAKDSLRYFSVLESLESISDKLAFMAKNGLREKSADFKDMHSQLERAFDGFNGDVNSINEVAEMRRAILRRISHGKSDRLGLYMLSSIVDDISRIAEAGLRPESIA